MTAHDSLGARRCSRRRRPGPTRRSPRGGARSPRLVALALAGASLLGACASTSASTPTTPAAPASEAPPPSAAGDRVVAVVNGRPIFLSLLRRRALGRTDPGDELLTLEQIIDEELLLEAADRMQIAATPEEIEQAIRNVRERAGMTEEELWQAAAAQGLSPEEYRFDLSRYLRRLRFVRAHVSVTEDDVRAHYDRELAAGGPQTPFEDVREELTATLFEAAMASAEDRLLVALRRDAVIENRLSPTASSGSP
ncbi:MAG: SurA N-terminal domain-containing protein [Sandaracinaceae bacterium]|nr:SurA N-terminal domain-containing protein [Sandaracinaceae bacterium]